MTILLVILLATSAMAQNGLGQGVALTPAFAQSVTGGGSCITMKASIDFYSVAIGVNKALIGSFDVHVAGAGNEAKLGYGISGALSDGILRLGMGLAYLPEQKWSLVGTIVQLKF